MTDDGTVANRPGAGLQPEAAAKPTSYAEKYRGTEWGRPEPPSAAPPPSTGRPWLIIGSVVLIGVAAAGLIGLAVSSPPGPAPALRSPGPSAVGSSGDSSIASPSPSPTPDPGKLVLAKFWTLVSAPDVSYHMTAKGKSVLDKKTIESYTESIDVVGDAYSGWIDSNVSPKSLIARQNGIVWVKVPGKPRVGRQTSERYFRLTPFLYVNMAAWVDYVRPVIVTGRRLHLLRSNAFYRPDIARMLDFSKFLVEPDTMVLDLYVTDAGVPVSAVFTADVELRDSTGNHVFHGRSDFAFSKVGAKLTIRIPSR